jgi:hypothetical protein
MFQKFNYLSKTVSFVEINPEKDSFGKVIEFVKHISQKYHIRVPKSRDEKIRVTRKPELPGPKYVYHFSSFIELYQTHSQNHRCFLAVGP